MITEEAIKCLTYIKNELCNVYFKHQIESGQTSRTVIFLDKAIDALKKQVPKKATLGGEYGINEWECPNCKSYFAELEDRPNYCCECGQKIDWSEERGDN